MNIHMNARPPLRRAEMAQCVVAGELTKAEAIRRSGISAKVVAKRTRRFKAECPDGMIDRSSRVKLAAAKSRSQVRNSLEERDVGCLEFNARCEFRRTLSNGRGV